MGKRSREPSGKSEEDKQDTAEPNDVESDQQRQRNCVEGTRRRDEDTAAAISAVSQGSTGTLRIKMHNKLAALVALGKYLGMFDKRPQNINVTYAISDKPMTKDEWKKRYVTPH